MVETGRVTLDASRSTPTEYAQLTHPLPAGQQIEVTLLLRENPEGPSVEDVLQAQRNIP